MPRKTFRRAVGAEPVELTIEGAQTTQVFPCRTGLSAGMLMKFTEAFGDDDDLTPEALAALPEKERNRKGAQVLPLLREFFDSCLQKEAAPRFWAMINNPDEEIDLSMLMGMTEWLTEVYSGDRPTSPTSSGTSEERSSGGSSTGGTSPELVETPIYSRPEPITSST